MFLFRTSIFAAFVFYVHSERARLDDSALQHAEGNSTEDHPKDGRMLSPFHRDQPDRQAILDRKKLLTEYKCGGIIVQRQACYPATRNFAPGSWYLGKGKWYEKLKKLRYAPCDQQCEVKKGMCSCPGTGSCSSVLSKNPGLRFIGVRGFGGTYYSVRVHKKTKVWDMLQGETKYVNGKRKTIWSWGHNPDKSKSSQGGLSIIDPSNVFVPHMGGIGSYCIPKNAAEYERRLKSKP